MLIFHQFSSQSSLARDDFYCVRSLSFIVVLRCVVRFFGRCFVSPFEVCCLVLFVQTSTFRKCEHLVRDNDINVVFWIRDPAHFRVLFISLQTLTQTHTLIIDLVETISAKSRCFSSGHKISTA